jgi:hypothetical protein
MKYIKTYENHNYQKIFENVDYDLILENNSDVKFFKTVQDKLIKRLHIDLYFGASFTWGIGMLYPVINSLAIGSGIQDITPQQIVCLTLFSITQIIKMSNDDVQKLRAELEKDNLMYLVDNVKKSLLSIHKIFKFVARAFGKVVDTFLDMLGYVGLLVSFINVVPEFFSEEGLNLETLPRKILVLSGVLGTYALKSVADTIVLMIKNKIKYKKQN